MRKYEMMVIFYPNEEEKRAQVLERFKGIITEDGGNVSEVTEWGSRKLAYEIDDLNEGYYIIINYEGTPKITDELDRIARISDSVMRHMIVREDE
ncbi:MAG: 30S ribosomal protein S6 [Tissierellia bacterium]|nr:30S ribosomal protein S6 [Tissierellia bacterium]